MEPTNGDARHDPRSVLFGPLVLDQEPPAGGASVHDGDAQTVGADQAPSLDPTGIGKLVEHEVAAMLGAAEAEAGRIRSRALSGVRMAEAKVVALQRHLDSTLAQLRELAEGIEQTPRAIHQLETELPTATGAATELPAVIEAAPDPERPAPRVTPSEEVVRLLRQHLS